MLVFGMPLINIFLFLILMVPPNLFKKLIKSMISGSIAQFDSSVLPFAPNAASIAFSVAPTEIIGNFIFVPINPFKAVAYI